VRDSTDGVLDLEGLDSISFSKSFMVVDAEQTATKIKVPPLSFYLLRGQNLNYGLISNIDMGNPVKISVELPTGN
jgi:hypothetical protein